MVQLAEWAQHIVTFRAGAADYIEGVSWVYKMHIFPGLTLFLIAPFTRLVHVWSIPISYLWRPYQWCAAAVPRCATVRGSKSWAACRNSCRSP